MSDDLEARKRKLAERLQTARGPEQKTEDPDRKTRGASGMAEAFKLSSEFIAAVVVGFVLGWGIDTLLGSTPFGMIIFLILGFCAGVVNVMRATGSLAPARGTKERETFEKSQGDGSGQD